MSKKVIFTVEDRIQEMVEKIKQKNGYSTLTQVWTQAMVEYHNREFKDYVTAIANKTPRKALTVEDRIKHQEDLAEAKRKALENKKLEILKRLGGELIDNNDGSKSAKWFTYWSKGKNEQQMPLMSLTEDLINNQFQGNLKAIREYHKLK